MPFITLTEFSAWSGSSVRSTSLRSVFRAMSLPPGVPASHGFSRLRKLDVFAVYLDDGSVDEVVVESVEDRVLDLFAVDLENQFLRYGCFHQYASPCRGGGLPPGASGTSPRSISCWSNSKSGSSKLPSDTCRCLSSPRRTDLTCRSCCITCLVRARTLPA